MTLKGSNQWKETRLLCFVPDRGGAHLLTREGIGACFSASNSISLSLLYKQTSRHRLSSAQDRRSPSRPYFLYLKVFQDERNSINSRTLIDGTFVLIFHFNFKTSFHYPLHMFQYKISFPTRESAVLGNQPRNFLFEITHFTLE